MVFGQSFQNKSYLISLLILCIAGLSLYIVRYLYLLEIEELNSVRNQQKNLRSQKDSSIASLQLLDDMSERFTRLPEKLAVEESRALIIELLHEAAASNSTKELRYQFFDRSTLFLDEHQQSTSAKLAVDTLILRGKFRHTVDFYEFIDFLKNKNKYFEIRGCEIKRISESTMTLESFWNLSFECIISWYSVDILS